MRLSGVLAIGANMASKRTKGNNSQRGFTLAELAVSMGILVVGVLGGMVMILMGMSRNNSNRVDTTSTNVAQTVLEQVAASAPNANPVLVVTDCVQTNPGTSNLKINTAAGGATLSVNGDINFAADNPVTLQASNYQLNYIVCGTNGLKTTYDVRWNIQAVGAGGWSKLVTVSARQPMVATPGGIQYIPPITLRTVVGM
jgi:prepilin-type N-terminal cleavage/methylation domain-containing protein